MNHRKPLKLLFYLNLLIIVLLIGYKLYLNLQGPTEEAVHTSQVEQLTASLANSDGYRFAVVGNINNSVGVFERRMIPEINSAGVEFLVSAGNAVSGGGEDKYRALQGTLSHLDMPYLLTFGEHEQDNFGSFRFYDHFGPHFYSVEAGDSLLVFLDSTSKTPWRWQIRWLRELLAKDDSKRRFLFVSHPLFTSGKELLFDQSEAVLGPPDFRSELMALIREYRFDAAFSATTPTYSMQNIEGTRLITTGGAGGLVLNNEDSFYHYLLVNVPADGNVSIELKRLAVGQHPVMKQLESLWFFIYSLFYVGYLNFLLLLAVFVVIGIKLYVNVYIGRDYYPNYDLDPAPFLEKPLRVAMFTNNYLPFIGGVPISIERLRRGLAGLGDRVLVVAPRYRDQPAQEDRVVRIPSLLALGEKREFRLANIFLPRIRRQVKSFKPDLIHLHHPFWIGSLGLFIARWLRVPVIYTYHTRLEHYAHFFPLPGRLFRNLISHAIIKRFANKCDALIVPTYSTEEYLRMIDVKVPTFVQPTGIEYQRFQDVRPDDVAHLRNKLGLGDEKVFVSVSRLSNEKNIDFMIDAIDRLRRESDAPFRFLMIGDGHQRRRLQQRIDQLDLQEHFTLVGAVPPEEMATWYALGDAFLFASTSETQGMVILEAMAAGLPVVAVRSSGIDDVVKDGFNGFKTPEKPSPWLEKTRQLLEDDALRERLGQQALEFAADYSVEQFSQDVRTIYGTVLASRADRESKQDSSPRSAIGLH